MKKADRELKEYLNGCGQSDERERQWCSRCEKRRMCRFYAYPYPGAEAFFICSPCENELEVVVVGC